LTLVVILLALKDMLNYNVQKQNKEIVVNRERIQADLPQLQELISF
jgi:hypothetical protein